MNSRSGTNVYETEFFAECPVNRIRILYRLKIETQDTITVEAIVSFIESIRSGFHEDIADRLFVEFQGSQTLVADHHSVKITTIRT